MGKILKEVLIDFNIQGNILNSELIKIDLHKKSNKMNVQLKSDSGITLHEVEALEQYLKNRFNVENVKVNIEYIDKFEFDIKQNWKDILIYLSKKYPLTKAILSNSEMETDDKNLNIIIKVKNASEILKSMEFDKIISDVIYMLSGEKYRVNYLEKIDEGFAEKFEEYQKKTVEDTWKKIKTEKPKKVEEPIKAQEVNKPTQKENKQEVDTEDMPSEWIYGRGKLQHIPQTSIKDLTVDSGLVLIDGEVLGGSEILDIQSRPLSTGKELITFNIYDGTGSIPCKVFAKDAAKSKELQKRIKGAKGIKVQGKAEYDKYARELTVMANIIIESEEIR